MLFFFQYLIPAYSVQLRSGVDSSRELYQQIFGLGLILLLLITM